MLKNNKLTYVSLFSSGGVGCYGFKLEEFECVATNEILSKRMDIQKANKICQYDSGYVVGDISKIDTKEKIYTEMQRWKKLGNDRVDVVLATPPCQGISVINHKKNDEEIRRNSLVVESIEVIKHIKPRFLIFENVAAFQKTLCTTPDNRIITIAEYIRESLGKDYIITGRIINLMNYGANSSRTRTVMIGVDKSYRNTITPYDIFPQYSREKTLRDVISKFSRLEWGQIDEQDFFHAFRTYDLRMRSWISGLKEGECAFNNIDPEKRPHRIKDGKHIENIQKNRDKYTRQSWDRFVQCIHTRNDQLAAQNTIHPEQDRVYSIRELMEMMTIPFSFKWIDKEIGELNKLSQVDKVSLYRSHELTIRQCIGEAVPTESMRKIAENIKTCITRNNLDSSNINKIISQYKLEKREPLKEFLKHNPLNLDIATLMRITELCNARREENAAFYTNKFIVNEIMAKLPDFGKEEISILEPSVGSGNFIPFLIKRYGNVGRVTIDVVDIDEDSIETLKLILEKIKIPENFKINIYCKDFLLMDISRHYDLVVGNPPFSKLNSSKNKAAYYKQIKNHNTSNLSAIFLEKCIQFSDCVALVLNKTILGNHEFAITRNILSNIQIQAIIDFGRYGFTGVSIETICLILFPKQKPKETLIYSMKHNKQFYQKQSYITDNRFPYFIIYRDEEFDNVANKMEFNVFDVFRDRQITKTNTSNRSLSTSLWVIKARNINDDGDGVTPIKDYDCFIPEEVAKGLNAYKFVNDQSVYLTPNMTYNPRVIENLPNSIVDGSTAILIPKYKFKLTPEQMSYFSSAEYRRFYSLARNLSTQSINVDKTSVFFYGKLKKDDL